MRKLSGTLGLGFTLASAAESILTWNSLGVCRCPSLGVQTASVTPIAMMERMAWRPPRGLPQMRAPLSCPHLEGRRPQKHPLFRRSCHSDPGALKEKGCCEHPPIRWLPDGGTRELGLASSWLPFSTSHPPTTLPGAAPPPAEPRPGGLAGQRRRVGPPATAPSEGMRSGPERPGASVHAGGGRRDAPIRPLDAE